jgi:hypothetical protein
VVLVVVVVTPSFSTGRVLKGKKGKERKKTHGKTTMWQNKDKTTSAKGEYGGGSSGRWWAWVGGV